MTGPELVGPDPFLDQYESAADANLLLTFEDLCNRLRRAAAQAQGEEAAGVLDCFLYAAGLDQLIEDDLDRHVLQLTRAAPHLEGLGGTLGPAAARTAAGAGRMAFSLRARRRGLRILEEQHRSLAALVGTLAHAVAADVLRREGRSDDSGHPGVSLQQQIERFLDDAPPWPTRLLASTLRLPNCFHSLDQEPGDCLRLVERFSTGWPDRDRRVVVVGLRTSGSYLAPLTAAFLRAGGRRNIEWLTIRPGRPMERVRAALAANAAADAVGLIVDDSPRTGKTLGLTAQLLNRHGVTPVLALQQLPGQSAIADVLAPWPRVVLPWEAWGVHDRLRADAILQLLHQTWHPQTTPGGPPRVVELTQTAVHAPARGHTLATYAARVQDPITGAEGHVTLCAEGVGQGWFGRQAAVVARRLEGLVPPMYAFGDGILVREWMDEGSRLSPERVASEPEATAKLIARYLATRADRLALREDVTFRAGGGNDAAWERIGDHLAELFGRAEVFLRPLTDRVSKRLLTTASPAVIDGAVVPSAWFGQDCRSAVKVDFHSGSLRTNGLPSCDPVLDLAQAAAAQSSTNSNLAPMLRADYETRTGEQVSDERWLLYTLVHLKRAYDAQLRDSAGTGKHQDRFDRVLAYERRMADALREYVGPRFFGDLSPLTSGPLCGIDIDGVLETRWCDFPAIGPVGALALRRLHRHGFRALLASGRSLDEVRDRCKAFQLPGGVGEYGSVVYVTAGDEVRTPLNADDRAALDRVRNVLDGTDAVYADPIYRYCVRAHEVTPDAKRRGLTGEAAHRVVTEAGVTGRVSIVAGELQTDFVAAGIDKAVGLRALARALGEPDDADPILRFAVGDAEPDIPMFRVAAHPYTPAGAASGILAHAAGMRSPGPAGLAEAVSRQLGHRHCSQCARRPPLDSDADLLLTVLGVMGRGRVARMRRAALLAGKLIGRPQ